MPSQHSEPRKTSPHLCQTQEKNSSSSSLPIDHGSAKLNRRSRLSPTPCNKRPKKLKDDDVAICFCKYDPNDPESACGDGCLNVMTSTECIHGYCPCKEYCKNQVVPTED